MGIESSLKAVRHHNDMKMNDSTTTIENKKQAVLFGITDLDDEVLANKGDVVATVPNKKNISKKSVKDEISVMLDSLIGILGLGLLITSIVILKSNQSWHITGFLATLFIGTVLIGVASIMNSFCSGKELFDKQK